MPRAIFFDVDGVLIHSLFHPNPARRRRWDQYLLEDLGVAREALEPLFGPAFADVIEGRQSLVNELDRFLPTVGFRSSTMDFLSYWFSRDANLNLQLLELIKRLRHSGKARLFLATNQEHIRAFHLWSEIGLKHYFDDMFYAARLGVGKKNPEFYRIVDSLTGPHAEPPLFFDDSPSVVRAAADHGWEAVVFTDVADCENHPWVADRI